MMHSLMCTTAESGGAWRTRMFSTMLCVLCAMTGAQARAKANENLSGVTILNRHSCDNGYRLYSSRNSEEAHLIDIDGREVHRWSYPQGHTWHYAEMLPNGHLVAIAKDIMILELDWNSQLVWQMKTRAHHDFARLANGNTLVVSRRTRTAPQINADKALSYDVIYERTPDNETVWEWNVEEHLDELAQLVHLILPCVKFNDWPHINTCESLPDSPTAKKDTRFQAGNILICGRHIDTIAVVERRTGRIVWAWGPGEILGPHMPTMLPNGHILLYDNGQNASVRVRGYTRVLELDPITNKIVWEYTADPPESFYSPSRGSNQRLPNGNTFIAESDSGRLFEVTSAGHIVWEFLNPDRYKNGRRVALYRAIRYSRPMVDQLLGESNDRRETEE